MTDEKDYEVDIPVTAPPEMAAEMLEDLREDGRITIDVRDGTAPKVADQIEWQLENEQPLLTFVDEFETETTERDRDE